MKRALYARLSIEQTSVLSTLKIELLDLTIFIANHSKVSTLTHAN